MCRVLLVCTSGISTGMILQRMRAAAENVGVPCAITACALFDLEQHVQEADLVLLGPQIRFSFDSLRERYPDKCLTVISQEDFGKMDGEAIMRLALEELKNKDECSKWQK